MYLFIYLIVNKTAFHRGEQRRKSAFPLLHGVGGAPASSPLLAAPRRAPPPALGRFSMKGIVGFRKTKTGLGSENGHTIGVH